MARGDERPVEVDLDRGQAADGRDDGARSGGGRGGAPRWLWPAAVVLVVAVLAIGDRLADRRERTRLDAFADVPGVVSSLADPLEEEWRTAAVDGMSAVGGVVVTVDVSAAAVVGRDLASGVRRWTVPLAEGVPAEAAQCPLAVPGRDGAGRVLCSGLGAEGAGPAFLGGLTVVDVADGDVVGALDAPEGVVGAGAVDGDVVVVARDPDAQTRMTVSRHDVVRGQVRWTVALDDVDPSFGARVHGDPDVVAVEGVRTTVVLDAGDGHELARGTRPTGPGAVATATQTARVVSRPGAGFGIWESRSAGRWYAPDGEPGPAIEGDPVVPDVTDGSAPHVLLLRTADGERLRAVDVSTGDTLWQRPSPARVLVALDGHAVVTGDGRLQSLDLATGDVRWDVELDPGEQPHLGEPSTDGLRVALRGVGDDGRLRLTAYDLADGGQRWRAPVPADAEYLERVGGRVAAVGRTDDAPGETVMVLG